MNRNDTAGAMGKLTRECDPEREVRSHWCWYRCCHSSKTKVNLYQTTCHHTPVDRQAVPFTVSTVSSSQLTQFMSPLFNTHQLNLFYKEWRGEHVSLHLKQNKRNTVRVAVTGYTVLAYENGRFDVECNLKVHDILIHTYTNALFYAIPVFWISRHK